MTTPYNENYLIQCEDPQISRNRFKLLVIGARGVGKTALTKRLRDNVFVDDATTSNVNIPTTQVMMRAVAGSIYKVEMQEVDLDYFTQQSSSSEEGGSSPRVHVIRDWLDVSGVFLLYDVTNADSYRELMRELKTIQRRLKPDCDVTIIGTKADIGKSEVKFADAESETEILGLSLFETSAKTGVNCDAALMETLDKLLDRQEDLILYQKEITDEIYQDTIDVPELHEPVESRLFCWLPQFLRRK